MALTPIKALLFLAGGTVAAGGVAYVSGVLDPYLGAAAPKLAAVPVPGTTEDVAGKPQKTARLPQPAATDALSPDAPATNTPAAAPGKEDILPPSFDVVRVEGDGSIVIAGKAATGATVEIVTGARVIGNAVAGPDGDFAVVIDEPLKPGGYQIVLRSTAPDNVVATSLETAVVSIPEKPDGQVLALVEKPGEPSKLITVPQPQPAPPLKAVPEGQAGQPVPPGDAPAASEGGPAANAPETSGADAPAAEPKPDEPATAQKPKEQPSEAASEQAPSDLALAEPAPSEQAQTEAKPDAPVELTPSAPAGDPKVAVEAVEIEGRKVFVAGVADAGRKVRVYANDTLLGDAEASPSGRFLIETERDLPVGDYIIRADALEPDGVKVAARAAVPFEREEGENLAAIAPSAVPQAETPVAGAEQSAAAPNPAEPQAVPSPTPAKPSAHAGASTEVPASGDPSAPPSPPSTADASRPAAPSGAVAPQPDAPAPAATAEAAVPSTQPNEQPGQSATAAPGSATAPAPTASAGAEPAKPAPNSEVAAAPEATPLAPKLESAPGAVIIRRGDSLWRISRRVYGLGVRYSTIYLANQEQISDPDRIWPGQVFKVPVKTSEGEEADMKAVGEQAVTTTTQ